jgi:DNA-binding NarL/FixJ family response regulator
MAVNLNVSKRNIERYISRLLDKTQTSNIQDLKSLYWYTKENKSRANDGNRTRE